ncbi:hypothetical protein KAH94_03125 [bacterium]|nr:hypothetical protein [bacterium]
MRRTILKVVTIASVIGCASQILATTGELRTPLAKFPYHYPLKPVDDGLWSLNFFGGAYVRCADKGIDPCKCTKTTPLSQLFFGKSDFKAEEAFAGGSIDVAGAPAYLKYVTLKPRFKYNEKGVNFGLETERRWDDCKWSVGARMNLPFKVIELERNVCSATMTDQAALEQELANETEGVVCRKDEFFQRKNDLGATGQEVNAIVPAYRLDFLTGLCMANGRPMVEYGKNYNLPNDVGLVRVAGIDITAASLTGRTVPMAVLYSADGTCPSQPFASPDEGTVLVPNGIGNLLNQHRVSEAGTITDIANTDNRGAFVSDIENYTDLGADVAALSKLYLVPVYDSNITPIAGENLRYYDRAVIIMNAIDEAISDLFEGGAAQAEQWFYNRGIHFCQTEKNIGVGDFDIDLYANYDIRDNWWTKVFFGVVMPTGKKLDDPGLLLAQPTGNNGHFEIKVGLQSGYKPGRWFAIHADAFYNHVFSASEWRAAAFKGATVKNIGPKVQAKVKWGYFTGHIDATFFHPENQNLGFSLGYEAYVKRCDKITFCGKCGIPGLSSDGTMMKELEIAGPCGLVGGDALNGEAKELDTTVLAKDTKRVSHKIRGEIFHRWNYCELFAGASHVLAGKNIMKESEVHFGLGINW